MRKYEMVVILDPSVDERTVTGTFEKLVQVIPTEGGTIDNVDIWGKRKFAYEIDKKTEGIYIVLPSPRRPRPRRSWTVSSGSTSPSCAPRSCVSTPSDLPSLTPARSTTPPEQRSTHGE